MKTDESWIRVRAMSAILATTLVACGGGGGGSDSPPPPPPPPPPPSSVQVAGKAVDGPLQGATACYDSNDNQVCDDGEPASRSASDADGNFIIDVPTAQAGMHRLIVNVPATAVDKDTGAAVGTAFSLVAPASGTAGAQSVFVSPLTTLVQQHIDTTGAALAAAADYIKTQAGLGLSPLADFTASAGADSRKAASVARLVVLTTRQQATALVAALGQADISGGTVAQADLDKAVKAAIAAALPALGAAAGDPAVAGATGAALQAALASAATAVVQQIDLTVPELVAAVGIAKLPTDPGTSTAPVATGTLASLQYTDANHWFVRTLQSSAADNTPDANGRVRYTDVRTRMVPYAYNPGVGVAQSFAVNNTVERAGDLHWNGSAWVGCSLDKRNTATVRDAQGRNSYNYCDAYEKGSTVRRAVDIAGQTLASVVTDKIRTLPGGTTGVLYAQWGPTDLSLLGSATFPAGSLLLYQESTPLETAYAYDVQATNQVGVFSAAVAAGGDGRAGTVACNTASTSVPATSLEEMAARMPGQPCVNNRQTNADGSSLDPSEGWGATTLSLGSIANGNTLPAGTANFYTTEGRLRVSFGASGNTANYHRCFVRRIDGSTRNCTPIGSGTYTIATLGDARVMTFSNLPALAQGLSSTRVFIERGGKVYFGYKNAVGIANPVVRLNLPAANAVLAPLGLPLIMPAEAPQPLSGAKASNAATMKGVWYSTDSDGAGIFRFGANGEFLFADTGGVSATGGPGYERGWLDIDASGKLSRLVTLDTNGDNGVSHSNPAAVISASDTAITATVNGVTETLLRLPDSGTGIVGMWATSATDFGATHFVFFGNGKVLSIHPAETEGSCVAARQGPPGVEWSDYSFDAATGALRFFNKMVDTSGCTGVFDSTHVPPATEANFVLTIAANGQTATVPVDEGTATVTLYRITPR